MYVEILKISSVAKDGIEISLDRREPCHCQGCRVWEIFVLKNIVKNTNEQSMPLYPAFFQAMGAEGF